MLRINFCICSSLKANDYLRPRFPCSGVCFTGKFLQQKQISRHPSRDASWTVITRQQLSSLQRTNHRNSNELSVMPNDTVSSYIDTAAFSTRLVDEFENAEFQANCPHADKPTDDLANRARHGVCECISCIKGFERAFSAYLASCLGLYSMKEILSNDDFCRRPLMLYIQRKYFNFAVGSHTSICTVNGSLLDYIEFEFLLSTNSKYAMLRGRDDGSDSDFTLGGRLICLVNSGTRYYSANFLVSGDFVVEMIKKTTVEDLCNLFASGSKKFAPRPLNKTYNGIEDNVSSISLVISFFIGKDKLTSKTIVFEMAAHIKLFSTIPNLVTLSRILEGVKVKTSLTQPIYSDEFHELYFQNCRRNERPDTVVHLSTNSSIRLCAQTS